MSTEDIKDAVIEKVEKKKVLAMKRDEDGMLNLGHGRPSHRRSQTAPAIGAFEGIKFDLESEFDGMEMDQLGDMRSALDRLVQDVASSPGAGPAGGNRLRVEAVVTEGVKAGTFSPPPMLDFCGGEDMVIDGANLQRADSDVLLGTGFADYSPERGNSTSSSSSASSVAPAPPPPPPKDAIKARERLIMEKRRELRRQEEEEDMGITIPARYGSGRTTRRRSLSTGDAEDLSKKSSSVSAKRRAAGRTDSEDGVLNLMTEELPLSDTIERELRKLEGPHRAVRRVSLDLLVAVY